MVWNLKKKTARGVINFWLAGLRNNIAGFLRNFPPGNNSLLFVILRKGLHKSNV